MELSATSYSRSSSELAICVHFVATILIWKQCIVYANWRNHNLRLGKENMLAPPKMAENSGYFNIRGISVVFLPFFTQWGSKWEKLVNLWSASYQTETLLRMRDSWIMVTLLRGASPVNESKNRYFFFTIIRLHMHSEIRM